MRPEVFCTVLIILHVAHSEKDVCIVKTVNGKLQKIGPGCKDTSSLTKKFDTISEFVRMSNGFSYKVIKVRKTYIDARRECEKYGGRLASTGLRDPTVKDDIWDLVIASNFYVWIGLNDLEQEGVWVWEDGVPMDNKYPDWAHGGPDNSKGRQHCASTRADINWRVDDNTCTALYYFVCERLG